MKNGRPSKSCYHPNDYNDKFKGPMRMEQALPESRNIPAIKTIYLAGLKDTFKNIKLMGIKSLNQPVNHYGLSLVLGAGEVQLLNLVSAYGVLSNEGVRMEPSAIIKILGDNDKPIYTQNTKPQNILKKDIALTMSKILSTDELKYPTFG
jgi:penicillin-binding protein 1A